MSLRRLAMWVMISPGMPGRVGVGLLMLASWGDLIASDKVGDGEQIESREKRESKEQIKRREQRESREQRGTSSVLRVKRRWRLAIEVKFMCASVCYLDDTPWQHVGVVASASLEGSSSEVRAHRSRHLSSRLS